MPIAVRQLVLPRSTHYASSQLRQKAFSGLYQRQLPAVHCCWSTLILHLTEATPAPVSSALKSHSPGHGRHAETLLLPLLKVSTGHGTAKPVLDSEYPGSVTAYSSSAKQNTTAQQLAKLP
jgi:hypothetical protein